MRASGLGFRVQGLMYRVQDFSAEVHAGSVRQNTKLTGKGFGRLPLYFIVERIYRCRFPSSFVQLTSHWDVTLGIRWAID